MIHQIGSILCRPGPFTFTVILRANESLSPQPQWPDDVRFVARGTKAEAITLTRIDEHTLQFTSKDWQVFTVLTLFSGPYRLCEMHVRPVSAITTKRTEIVYTVNQFPWGYLPYLGGGGGGGVSIAQVNTAISAALADLSTPVTAAQVEALEAAVAYFNSLDININFQAIESWKQAIEDGILSLDAAKANVASPTLTGEATLDGATLDVLRLRLKDGEKGFVIRSYGAGANPAPGLYLWDAAGHVVGRLTTSADLDSKADGSQILGLQAQLDELPDQIAAKADVTQILSLQEQLDRVPDQIAAAAGARTITVHEGVELPQPTAMPFTPRDLIDAWRGYDSGLHLFTEDKNHFARRGTLVLLSRFIDEDTGGLELRLSVDAGDTTNHAVIRDWGGGSSWFMRQEGLQIVYLESPKGDAPFGMPTVINLAGMAADVQAVGFAGMAETQAAMAETVRTTEALAEMLTPGEWKPLPLGAGVTPNGVAQYRHNAGRIELRGEFKFTTRSTYFGGAATLPPEARPEVEHVQPAAMREDGVAPRTGYVTVQANGNLNFNPTGTVNRVSLGGIWWPEPGFTGPQTKPAPADD